MTNLDNATNVHLGDHLCSEEESDNQVDGKGDIDKRRMDNKCLWSVHTDRDQTEERTSSEDPTHTCQQKHSHLILTL